jgi:hypothetical protein
MDNRTIEQRLLAKIQRDEATGCWNWTGGHHPDGYGLISVHDKTRPAHRVSFELYREPIPEKMQIHHICRNKRCVNPNHLSFHTCREHLLLDDTLAAANTAKTHCPKGHPYFGENLYVSPCGDRHCRTCKRAADLHRYHHDEAWRARRKKARQQRNQKPTPTTCRRGHPRTPDFGYIRPDGHWRCRSCYNAAKTARRQRTGRH